MRKDDYHVQCAKNIAEVLRSDLLAPDADVTCTDTHRADSYVDIPACDPSLQALQEVGHLLKKNTLSLNVRERGKKTKT